MEDEAKRKIVLSVKVRRSRKKDCLWARNAFVGVSAGLGEEVRGCNPTRRKYFFKNCLQWACLHLYLRVYSCLIALTVNSSFKIIVESRSE